VEGRGVSEDELWGRSLAGDGQAFGVLFERHGGRVFRHACRLVTTQHDAEDVTAAAFLELWRRRSDVRLVEGSVLPWLLVTTGNVARNSVRSTRRYREFLARLPREATAPDAAEVALDRSVLGLDADLRAALLGLDEVDLHLVALVALEDYPIADAARVLKLTPAAAKSRLHRARHRLRAVLGPHSTTPEPNATAGGAL
jgi:RNA polymerase sigma-70 factor (ECF subfamily)